MASRLEDIATAIQARVVGPTYAFGQLEVAKHARFPRVVWVPGPGESFGPMRLAGGTQRQVRARVATLTARIWGADLEATENLVHALVWAADDEQGPMMTVAGGRWVTQEEPEAGHVRGGQLYELEFQFAIPVYAPASTTVEIESIEFDATGAVIGDGVLHIGEETP